MPRSSARIHATIWQDPEWLALSAGAQRMYVLALSQPNLSLCGVVSYTANRWAGLAKDSTVRSIRAAVKELEQARFVVVDESTEELWIRSFVKHDGVLRSPNAKSGMIRDFGHVHSQGIRKGFLEGLPEEVREDLAEPSRTHDAESPPPPPLSTSSSSDDEEGLRKEAERRLAERLAKPGLERIVDPEAWIAKCVAGIRAEREESQLERARRERDNFDRAVSVLKQLLDNDTAPDELEQELAFRIGDAALAHRVLEAS